MPAGLDLSDIAGARLVDDQAEPAGSCKPGAAAAAAAPAGAAAGQLLDPTLRARLATLNPWAGASATSAVMPAPATLFAQPPAAAPEPAQPGSPAVSAASAAESYTTTCSAVTGATASSSARAAERLADSVLSGVLSPQAQHPAPGAGGPLLFLAPRSGLARSAELELPGEDFQQPLAPGQQGASDYAAVLRAAELGAADYEQLLAAGGTRLLAAGGAPPLLPGVVQWEGGRSADGAELAGARALPAGAREAAQQEEEGVVAGEAGVRKGGGAGGGGGEGGG